MANMGAFAGGVMSGYSFVDKAYAAKDEAKLRELKMDRLKSENALYDVAVEGAKTDSAFESLSEITNGLLESQTKINGSIVSSDLNLLTSATGLAERDKMIQTVTAKMKANPASYKDLQIKDPTSMSVLNIANSQHKTKLTGYLDTQGITAQSFGYDVSTSEGETAWNKKLGDYANYLPVAMVDNEFINLEELGIAMGADAQATPDQQSKLKQTWKTLRGLSKDMVANSEGVPFSDPDEHGATTGKDLLEDAEMGQEGYISPDSVADTAERALADSMPPDESGLPADAFTGGATQPAQAPQPMAGVEAEINEVTKMNAITAFNQKREQGANFKGNPYTRKNEAGSSAYGKYQVMPDTNATIASRLGMSIEESLTPEGQEAVFKELTRENSTFLNKWGVADTPASQYVVHQLGSTQAKKYFDGNIDGKVLASMKNQYSPKAIKGMSDNEVIAKWTNDFARDDNGQMVNVTPVTAQVASMANETKPAGKWDMEKVYALLGKKYPGTETTKMQNFNFLKANGFDDQQSFDAIFGRTTGTLDRVSKAQAQRARYPEGSREYNELTKYIEKLGKSGTSSEYDFNQWDAELQELEAMPNPTERQMDRMDTLREKMSDSNKTASEQTADSKEVKRRRARESAGTIADSEEYKAGQLTRQQDNQLLDDQDQIRTNSPSKTVERDGQIVKDMSANKSASVEITDVLGRMEEGGDLAPMEKGIIDNTAQWIEEKVSDDVISDDRRATIEANIKAGSALGYLQATLIKAMSGTAAAEAEVMRLQKVMQGNNWNQPEALKVALNEFNDGLKRRNKELGGQLRVSPYENYKLNQLGAPTRQTNTAQPAAQPTATPKVYKRTIGGVTKTWDGTKWVD